MSNEIIDALLNGVQFDTYTREDTRIADAHARIEAATIAHEKVAKKHQEIIDKHQKAIADSLHVLEQKVAKEQKMIMNIEMYGRSRD